MRYPNPEWFKVERIGLHLLWIPPGAGAESNAAVGSVVNQVAGQMLKDGRLKVPGGEGQRDLGAVTYHDPCYLARVNGIHEAPREVLKTALGAGSAPVALREMPLNREKTFCCGAGGGRMWMEEDPKKRVFTARAGEALATGAKTVVLGCPFCLTMITDGVAAQDSQARVKDVAEILVERLGL